MCFCYKNIKTERENKMSDEFENINDRLPDLSAVLAQRIASKNNESLSGNLPPPGTIDPYKLMLKKKQEEVGEVDSSTIQKWPEKDIVELEDYCKKTGIVGFNCGKMNPIAAFHMLKQKFGDYTNVPLEERVPSGYEKRGTLSKYGPNYPYGEIQTKKQILHD